MVDLGIYVHASLCVVLFEIGPEPLVYASAGTPKVYVLTCCRRTRVVAGHVAFHNLATRHIDWAQGGYVVAVGV